MTEQTPTPSTATAELPTTGQTGASSARDSRRYETVGDPRRDPQFEAMISSSVASNIKRFEQGLQRRQWAIVDVDQAVARELIVREHYAKGCPNTGVYRHGLRRVDDARVVGVALWLPPTKVAAQSVAGDDWRGVLTLSRLAIEPDVPTNAASFLLGGSMRKIDRKRWPVLLTYADTGRGHTGAIYLATNWQCIGEVKAGDTWTAPDGSQRGRKRGAFTYTVAEMEEMGYPRNPSAPKVKFVHRVAS